MSTATLTNKAKLAGTIVAGLRESSVQNLGPSSTGLRQYNVVLMTAGPGNPADRHLYSQKCIDSSASAFEGKPCYLNHPDAIQERILPERRVEDIAGYFSNVHPEGNALCAVLTLTSTPAGDFAEKFINDCLVYAQANPGQNLGGISINADGDEIPVQYEGQQWLQVDNVKSAISADIVTLPARGGEFLNKIMESYRAFREATSSAASIKDVVTELRDKIIQLMSTGDKPEFHDLRRLADNALTMIGSGNQPKPTETNKEKRPMANLESKKAEAETAKAEAEAKMGEAKHAFKKLAEIHKGIAAEAEANGDSTLAAIHKAEAEKHSKLAGESEGDVTVATKKDGTATVTHKADPEPTADGQATVAPVADPNAAPDEESKKKMESMRKELAVVKAKLSETYLKTKLTESGLPEFYHASIRESAAGKSDAEIDTIVEARLTEFTSTVNSLRESGSPRGTVTVPSREAELRKLLKL